MECGRRGSEFLSAPCLGFLPGALCTLGIILAAPRDSALSTGALGGAEPSPSQIPYTHKMEKLLHTRASGGAEQNWEEYKATWIGGQGRRREGCDLASFSLNKEAPNRATGRDSKFGQRLNRLYSFGFYTQGAHPP